MTIESQPQARSEQNPVLITSRLITTPGFLETISNLPPHQQKAVFALGMNCRPFDVSNDDVNQFLENVNQ